MPKDKGFMNKGDVCPNCGYVFRKWAVKCPMCRKPVAPEADITVQLRELARKHLRKLEDTKE